MFGNIFNIFEKMLFLIPSIILLFVSVLFRNNQYIQYVIKIPLVLLVGIFLTAFYIMSDSFTQNGIDESVWYHLQMGVDGFHISGGNEPIAFQFGIVMLFGILVLYSFARIAKKQKKQTKTATVGPILLLIGLVIHPAIHNFYTLYANHNIENVILDTNDRFETNYIVAEKYRNTKSKNFIYLYLESFEQAYLDDDVFPGLTPNLQRLQKQHISYTNISQLPFTSWTIAGMVSSQCGLPLMFPGNMLTGMDNFLTKATCVGDILSQSGYYLAYVGGADLSFAGKGHLYRSHKFHSVEGKETVINNPHYQYGWGAYDDNLLSFLYKKYALLSEEQTPFGIFSLTMDTHGPDGVISQTCLDQGVIYQKGEENMLNAIHCSDYLVGEFVKKIKAHPNFENTVIVLASDHLQMGNIDNNFIGLENEQRKNLFIIIDGEEQEVISKTGSTLDVGITLLNKIGYKANALGLGRNLDSQEETITEKYDNYTHIFNFWRKDIVKLWDFPNLYSGIVFENNLVNIADQSFSYPMYIFYENNEITKIGFDAENVDDIVKVIDETDDTRFVWVDDCTQFKKADSGACYLEGNTSSVDYAQVKILSDGDEIKISNES